MFGFLNEQQDIFNIPPFFSPSFLGLEEGYKNEQPTCCYILDQLFSWTSYTVSEDISINSVIINVCCLLTQVVQKSRPGLCYVHWQAKVNLYPCVTEVLTLEQVGADICYLFLITLFSSSLELHCCINFGTLFTWTCEGADMDVCLTQFGHCNFISPKHAYIFYDEVNFTCLM